jgi:hypothetical protein
VLCKEDKIVIPASLQHRAVSWYHHYLQHPGHSLCIGKVCNIPSDHRSNLADLARLIRDTAQVRACPTKLVITTPWEALCVDLIGPYTLNSKDSSSIDFMCLTIDPATSWFEIVELLKLQKETKRD